MNLSMKDFVDAGKELVIWANTNPQQALTVGLVALFGISVAGFAAYYFRPRPKIPLNCKPQKNERSP